MSSGNDVTSVQNEMEMYTGSHVQVQKRQPGGLREYCKKWFKFESRSHRQNFIQTFCVYLNFVLLGWNYGQLGTAFQDLQLVLDTNVKQTSLIFTMNSVGYMVGSISFGFIYDKMDKLLLLGVVSIVSAVASAVIPWFTTFVPFLALRLATGFMCGGLDSGGNAKVASCWTTDGAKYMQALHFSYAFGGIISPLVTGLFLAPRTMVTITANQTTNTSLYNDLGNSVPENKTLMDDMDSLNATNASQTQVLETYGETKVHIAFVITGVLTALAGSFYLILYSLGYEKVHPYTASYQNKYIREKRHYETEGKSYPKMSNKESVVFLVVFAVSCILFSAVEAKFQSFLMPFMLMQMDWVKKDIVFLISLLWGFYGLGRFLGIAISRFLSPATMIVSFMVSSFILSSAILVGAVFKINILLWTVIPLSGLAISVVFPSFIVWTDQNVRPITGKMAGYFLFVGALGFLIDPLYVGILMENVSPLCFVYLQIGEISVSLLVYVCLVLWIRYLKRATKPDS